LSSKDLKLTSLENKISNKEVIETNDHTIIVSDFGTSSFQGDDEDDDDSDANNEQQSEDENEMHESKMKDALDTKSRAKMSKEASLINQKLTKLEKRKKLMTKQTSKTPKRLKGNKTLNKSTRKFQIKDSKIKTRKRNGK
jgi:hypothetical protein